MLQAPSRSMAPFPTRSGSPRAWLPERSRSFIWKIKHEAKRRILGYATCSMFCCLTAGEAYSSPLLNVSFSGDNGQLSTYYSSIANDLVTAAAKWEKLFVSGTAFTLSVDVNFDNSPTANAASLFTTTLYNVGPLTVSRQGAVDAVLNGVHNPSGPYDAVVNIGTSYLTNDLWFDPDPMKMGTRSLLRSAHVSCGQSVRARCRAGDLPR